MINNSIVDRQGPSPWYALVNRCSCLDHSEWEKLYLTRVICGSLSLEFVAVRCFSGIVLISPALSVFFLCLTCVACCTVCIWAPLFPCLIQLLFHHITFHFPHFFSSAPRGGDSNRPGEVHRFPSRVWFACCFFALLACVVLLVRDQNCFGEGVVLDADLSMFLRIFFLPCFDPPRRLPIQHMLRSRSCVLVLIPVLFRWVSVLLAAYFRRLFLLVVSDNFF